MRRFLIVFFLLLIIFGAVAAEAGVETPTYGFNLGHYDKATDNYHVGASKAWWDGQQYWTDGPWSIKINGVREGSVINFSNVLLNTNNGYPLVGSDKWDQWIVVFGGEPGYVKGQLNSSYLGLSWEIKNPALRTYKFANLSDIALLCGGKGGPFDNKQMYSTFYKSTGPTSTLTPNKTAIRAGEAVTFTIQGTTNTYYNQYMNVSFAGAGTTYINNQRFDGKNITTTQPVTLNNPGTYTFSLILKDAVMRKATNKTVIISVSPVDQIPTPPVQPPPDTSPPPDNPPPDINQPPIAKFDWPSSAYAGENVTVDEYSVDYDGAIASKMWDLSTKDVINNLGFGGGKVNFNTPGDYDLKLTVTDDDGATDSLTKSIAVYKPLPTAIITTSGTLKENRKVILSSASSKAPACWPIDHSKDEWVIEPVTGGAAVDIKIGTMSDSTQEVLFKQTGTYRAKLRVTNAKGSSDWAAKEIVVLPDVPPIADFKLNATINYRNPSDANQANIFLTDTSMSSDGDIISQRTWSYKFDSDNDGDFLDEAWTSLDNTNNTAPSVKVNKVGKYLFSLTAKESFGQETIPIFIVPADYRSGDTSAKVNSEKIVEVKNIAPITSFQAAVKPKVDIVFSQGFLSAFATRFPTMINNLETIVGNKLKAKIIDYAFYNTTPNIPPQTTLATIAKTSNVDNRGIGYGDLVYPPSYPSYSAYLDRIYDLGSVIPASSIVEIKSTLAYDIQLETSVSPDGINWQLVIVKGEYDRPSVRAAQPGQDLPCDVRYIRYHTSDHRFLIPKQDVLITYETPTPTYDIVRSNVFSGWYDFGLNSYSQIVFDLGRLISRDEITRFKIFGREFVGSVYFAVSADNVTWYDTAHWNAIAPWGHYASTPVYSTAFITKDMIPIQNFRYTKLYVSPSELYGGVIPNYVDTYMQWISTTGGSPRATLADIQTQANLVTRPGAKKYVVSLAEEPYIDLNATNLDNTANILNTNKVFLTAFANVGSTPTMHQLTTKVNEQKLITTATDLSPALNQLADTIISSTPFNFSSGPFYLLQGQSMAYTPSYSDYESDPKVTDNWYISHDPSFLDNNTGISVYNNQTVTSPVNTLDKVGKYSITYKAKDDPTGNLLFAGYNLWSNPSPTTIIVHRKPIADFTVTAGTVNAVDTSYDPDFQYQRPDKGIVERKWMWKKTTSSTWNIGEPSGIPALGDYIIHLEVKDVYGAMSDPVEKTVTVVNLNKPPVANFFWSPALIYEGDMVATTNLSTDPEGGALTYQWTTFDSLGVTNTYTTKNISLARVTPGTYWLTLRVWNQKGLSSAITKSFIVNALGIIGYVEHTPQWNLNRIRYNQNKTGTDDNPRPYHVFFAIECFVLKADTTDTGLSTTKATSLRVDLLKKGETELLISNSAKTFWYGEMSRAYFEHLADGNYTFRFTVTYSNGVVKTHALTIVIEDSWLEYFNFHRTE